MKKILILGGSLFYVRTIKKVRAAGFRVFLADRDPNAPGRVVADAFRAIDIVDQQGVLEWAREEKIDGVMAINDFGTPTAAYVSETMGLVGNSFDTAVLANNKGLMRECWKRASLPNPDFVICRSFDDVYRACCDLGFPVVVKPALTGGGGRGISVVREPDEIAWAYEFALPPNRCNQIVVERFLEGTELTVETVSIKGNHSLLAISDKVKPEIRTRVATSLNYFAAISEESVCRVMGVVQGALDALGHYNGIAHTEMILENDTGNVSLIETGVRPGGGHIFHTLIEACSGIDAPVLNASIFTGQDPIISRPLRRGGVYRFFTLPHGRYVEVKNMADVARMPGILDIGMTVSPGTVVGYLYDSMSRPGFVVTGGNDRADAIAIADAAERALQFVIEPIDEKQRNL